jgi:hypothetical protein
MSRARILSAASVRRLFCLRRSISQALFLTCVAALTGVAGQARAEDDVLKLVPEKALGFVVVNRPASADAKLQQLAKQMKLPIPSLLGKLEGPGGIQTGVDKKRPIAMLVLPQDNNPIPAPVFLIPIRDYAKFLEQFKSDETEAGVTKINLWGDQPWVRHLGGYAAISGEREALENLKAADEPPTAVAAWRTWLAKQDAGGVVLAPGIRILSEKVQQGIVVAKAVMGQAQAGEQAKQAAAALDMYVTFFKAAEKQVASFGIGIERDDSGVVRLSKRACLISGKSWARFVSSVKPAEQNVLAGLPAGPFVVAGGGPLSKKTSAGLMDWSFSLIKDMRGMYGLSEEQADKLSELGKQKFPPIHGMSFLFGVGSGDEPIMGRMLGVMRVENPKTFLTDYDKFAARYNEVIKKVDSPVFRPFHMEKAEIDGIRARKVTMTMPQMPNMPPQSVKMLDSMFGPGGKIVAWIVPCDEHTVLFSYTSGEPLRQAIAAIKEGKRGLADDAAVAKVAALLPSGTSWSFYVSPKGGFDFVRRITTMALPAGTKVHIPEFGATPPVAIAVTTGADEVEAQMIVPAEVLEEIGRMIPHGGPVESAQP